MSIVCAGSIGISSWIIGINKPASYECRPKPSFLREHGEGAATTLHSPPNHNNVHRNGWPQALTPHSPALAFTPRRKPPPSARPPAPHIRPFDVLPRLRRQCRMPPAKCGELEVCPAAAT
ncbi:hypothetical protein HBH56_019280 [Parastagonospora nodorum]|uniref:Uncharacterized protein n=1 Tax=Phaeosphaeria nodorum (strain SN15 / ATCC MYA-4574 / FGSC 10173) TaxID=321614 RepID=A0A7U2F2M4_PHANO|nr:hypothetical protein HBH56_019280 [Parastagonospora nodorum]QRC95329.1 hypothetical protein JI435_030300 [Parastagonospora nodorum SN15]KAH3937305.1 hypothetical protein HBH54_015210 [Parastagonospora nodorum]KAH3953667.1 hypothetical protein HBH53_027360 [Parastagonospora nodorum]KAH3990300.1 hypothetical protein HBH52_004090 [Parastagonospora nodorum]